MGIIVEVGVSVAVRVAIGGGALAATARDPDVASSTAATAPIKNMAVVIASSP